MIDPENTRNLVNYVHENHEDYEIEIVANGNSVKGLLKADPIWADAVCELSQKHVKITACKNSLHKFDIREEELFDTVTVVPAGVVEIVKKQQEGYAYIKP